MGEKSKGFSAFGIWLRTQLMERNMTQRDLAAIMETSEACVSRWVRGARNPARKQLNQILEIFNCHIEYVPNEVARNV